MISSSSIRRGVKMLVLLLAAASAACTGQPGPTAPSEDMPDPRGGGGLAVTQAW